MKFVILSFSLPSEQKARHNSEISKTKQDQRRLSQNVYEEIHVVWRDKAAAVKYINLILLYLSLYYYKRCS